MLEVIDPRLQDVWADAREFCALVNLASMTGSKIKPRLFQETMVTLQYRLLHSNTEYSKISHAIQIGVLVFTTTIFLHVAGIPTRYYWLTSQIRKVLRDYKEFYDVQSRKLRLWLLFVSAVSGLYDGSGKWLDPSILQTLTDLSLKEWEDVKAILKAHLWIDVLHDSEGKRIMERCLLISTQWRG